MARTVVKKALAKRPPRRPEPPPVPVEESTECKWPSSPEHHGGAKCYVCGEISSKQKMDRVGQNKEEVGTDRYIWRHRRCVTGSTKWKQHFMGKTSMCKYYLSSLTKAEVASMTPERQAEIGKLLVKNKIDLLDQKIIEAVDKKKRKGVKSNVRGVRKAGGLPVRQSAGRDRQSVTDERRDGEAVPQRTGGRKRKRSGRRVSIRRV